MISATYDQRQDNKANLQSVDSVSLGVAEDFIRQLDGNVRTEVVFEKGETTLSVAGGDEYFFVSAFTSDERSLVLRNPAGDNESEFRVVVGGQPVSLSASRVNELQQAIDAVAHFYKSNDFSDGNWIEE
jgi:hypothetical protein